MKYEVIDICKVSDYDLGLFYFMKKNFESDDIKIELVVKIEPDCFGYYVEIRKMRNE